jgi:hypothetical protein
MPFKPQAFARIHAKAITFWLTFIMRVRSLVCLPNGNISDMMKYSFMAFLIIGNEARMVSSLAFTRAISD